MANKKISAGILEIALTFAIAGTVSAERDQQSGSDYRGQGTTSRDGSVQYDRQQQSQEAARRREEARRKEEEERRRQQQAAEQRAREQEQQKKAR